MSDSAAGRPFLVGIPGDISAEARLRLDAAGLRWRGSYDVLREQWERDIDSTPWTVRHVVQVAANDADAAVQQVADALGQSEARAGMEAAEAV
jgi:hypothetical protein